MALYGSVFTSSRFKGQSSVKQAPGLAHIILTERNENTSRDRLVVRTLRCGRSNPGSNPGHGMFLHHHEIKMKNEIPYIFPLATLLNLIFFTIQNTRIRCILH